MNPISTRTLLLMQATKKSATRLDDGVEFVTAALRSEFYCDMTIRDALHHALAAVEELAAQPEFRVRFDKLDFIMSPVRYRWGIKMEDTLPIGEFYKEQLRKDFQDAGCPAADVSIARRERFGRIIPPPSLHQGMRDRAPKWKQKKGTK